MRDRHDPARAVHDSHKCPQRLFLIDGSSQMYRAYHAMRGSGLVRPGRQVHARRLHLRHDAAQADSGSPAGSTSPPRSISPGPTFRSEMATDYKANRAPMPPDLAEQIPWVHEACEAMGVPILTYERFEADDVIGTLATQAVAEPASKWRSSRATRTSSSSFTTASRSTTRATTARGTTRTA